MSSWNPLNWQITHRIDGYVNPSYKTLQTTMANDADALKKLACVFIVISAVASYFGMRWSSISLGLVSLPFAYVGYNMYCIGQNYQTISENPNNYGTLLNVTSVVTGTKSLDSKKLRECLELNTFYFGQFIDKIVIDRITFIVTNKR